MLVRKLQKYDRKMRLDRQSSQTYVFPWTVSLSISDDRKQ